VPPAIQAKPFFIERADKRLQWFFVTFTCSFRRLIERSSSSLLPPDKTHLDFLFDPAS